MTLYRVMGMATDATAGVGPAEIEADTPDAAKAAFAKAEGTTLTKLQKTMVVMAEEIA